MECSLTIVAKSQLYSRNDIQLRLISKNKAKSIQYASMVRNWQNFEPELGWFSSQNEPQQFGIVSIWISFHPSCKLSAKSSPLINCLSVWFVVCFFVLLSIFSLVFVSYNFLQIRECSSIFFSSKCIQCILAATILLY